MKQLYPVFLTAVYPLVCNSEGNYEINYILNQRNQEEREAYK